MRNRMLVLIAVLASATTRIGGQEKPKLSQPSGTVTLSLADYDRLIDRAAHPPKRQDPPPIPSAISSAELKLQAKGASVRGAVTLEGEVYEAGPTKVALLPGGTLLDARREGRVLPLLAEGSLPVAIVNGPGPFSIKLDWEAPIVSEPGRASFVFPVPVAGSVRASFEVPGEQTDVRIEPGLITRRSAAGGRTLLEASLDPGRPTRFSWSAREAIAATPPREVRFLSDVKTLISVGEADLQLAVLLDINVLEGEPARFDVTLPAGFEVTGASGSTLESTSEGAGRLALTVREAGKRRHQFLVNLTRSTEGGSFEFDASTASLNGAQRELGEIAVEGIGSLELTAKESGTLRRMDATEVAQPLRSLAREPILAAFRYHRRANEGPELKIDVRRFPDAPVLAALAEHATVTTLTTTEGRRLTEIALTVRNHSQPYLRVILPQGANLVSADVAGETVKPVLGDDGARVPLLRPRFRPVGPYSVSFVYSEPGNRMGKRGAADLTLPRMDVPITLLEWELFLPDRYKVKRFEGTAQPLASGEAFFSTPPSGVVGGSVSRLDRSAIGVAGGVPGGVAGEISGTVADESGASIPGATVELRAGSGAPRTTISGPDGRYRFLGVPAGRVELRCQLSGFATSARKADFPASGSWNADFRLKAAAIEEIVTVTAEAPLIDTKSSVTGFTVRPNEEMGGYSGAPREKEQKVTLEQPPSANVMNLQRRVAGVLPVRIDVPRAGASFRFRRPLVLDEETTVRFQYRAR